MWRVFCQISFRYPEAFYQIFFNKHSDSLDTIIRQYYDLFPEDMGTDAKNLKRIFTGTRLDERNEIVLTDLIEAEKLTDINISLINEMMVALYHDLLLKRIADQEGQPQEAYEQKMMAYVDFILAGAFSR